MNILICQYAYMLVYVILDNSFTNETLDDINKLLTLIGGSILADCEQNS